MPQLWEIFGFLRVICLPIGLLHLNLGVLQLLIGFMFGMAGGYNKCHFVNGTTSIPDGWYGTSTGAVPSIIGNLS